MTSKSPYDRILENMAEYPSGIPMVGNQVSAAFREYIELMYTPEEAKIAQFLSITPYEKLKTKRNGKLFLKLKTKLQNNKWILKKVKKLSIKSIAAKIGKNFDETKVILDEMAHNGIIQDIGGYSYFLSIPHLLNIGFKHSKSNERLGKRGAELYLQFFVEEQFYKRYQSSDKGTPMTRVVPIDKSIANKNQIMTIDEIHGILENCHEPIVFTDCPCRNRTETLGIRECTDKFPIQETCIQVGLFGEYFLNHGEGKQYSRKEAHEAVERFSRLGLVFTTENSKYEGHFVICVCCACCCALLRGITRFPEKNPNAVAKANFIAKVNSDFCKGCGICAKKCPFKAISITQKIAQVDPNQCYGCGVCAVSCPTHAIQLYREKRAHIYENQTELMNKIYKENRNIN